MNIKTIKFLCIKYDIRPSKKLGQNFLVDANVARKMCEAAELNAEDCVVEVGPGLGALTVEIAKRAGKVVAVEVDQKMFVAAQDILAPHKNVEVVRGDILRISNSELAFHPKRADRPFLGGGYKVVASLPYSITSAVLRKFTEQEPRPELCVFLVQKEVAERVCAQPRRDGESRRANPSPQPSPLGRGRKGEGMSVLSVAVQYYGKPEIVEVVSRSAFWPVPEVDSAILRIEIYRGSTSGSPEVEPRRLFQIVRMGFSSRRKQLQNNLMAGLRLPRETVLKALKTIGLPSNVRAQELAVEKWIELSRIL